MGLYAHLFLFIKCDKYLDFKCVCTI